MDPFCPHVRSVGFIFGTALIKPSPSIALMHGRSQAEVDEAAASPHSGAGKQQLWNVIVMILRIGHQFSPPSFLRSGYGPGEGVRTHAHTNCMPTPLITRLRPQEGSESGQLSARGFEPTQTPTAALQAYILTILSNQAHQQQR